MSKPQASKRARNIKRIEGTDKPPMDLGERREEALEEALRYLNDYPPRVSLARNAIKSAMNPESPRWSDPIP